MRSPDWLIGGGRDELMSWLGPPSGTSAPPRDELVIKVPALARRRLE